MPEFARFPPPSRDFIVTMITDRRLSRRLRTALGIAVVAWTYFHVATGLRWSEFFHPDELPIAHWMRQSHAQGYISDRAYPGGWFVIANACTHTGAVLWDLGRRWRSHTGQAGAVRAVEAGSFDCAPEKEIFKFGIQNGRNINAVLAALAALFLYWMALEMGVSAPAAAFGALLLGAQPFLLEHAHYCETDMAVPFSLTLAGALAARGMRLGSRRWHVAAMFAAGFAIACKYTLIPLALWPLTVAVAFASAAAPGRRLRLFAAISAVGYVALVLGFLAGTPALWRAPRFFLASMRRISALTYAEGIRALGPAYYSPRARIAWRASSLGRELVRLGPHALLVYGLSCLVWLRRSLRPHLATFPLLLLLFAPQALFLMPWIRNQELLPLLPPLCLGVAIAVDILANAAFTRRSRPVVRLVAGLVFAAILVVSIDVYRDGRRILTSFQRRDTRAECQNWLAECAADGLRLTLDRYIAQAIRGTSCDGIDWPGVPEKWPALLDDPAFEGDAPRYVLRNASFEGRRTPGPDAASNAAAFARAALRLRAWNLAPGHVRPLTFAQPDVELWAVPTSEETAAPDIPVVLDRPVYFTPGLRPVYAADESFAVGPVRAVPTVGQRHTFHPAPDVSKTGGWAVSRIVGGPVTGAAVSWEGLAEPRQAPLAGRGGVALFRFGRRPFRYRTQADVRPGARLRLRGADDQATMCATWSVADRAEAAHALRRGGDPAAALALLREEPNPDAAECVEAFLAAVDAGEAPEAAWIGEARKALAALEGALAATADAPANGGAFRVRGVPLRVLRDFAHVRLGDHPQPRADTLPVSLPPGSYRVSLLPPAEAALPPGGRIFVGQNAPAEVRMDEQGRDWWNTTVTMRREALLGTVPEARAVGEQGIAYRRIVIDWEPAEQLARLAAELKRALARVASGSGV